jgi:hypothetical protein
MISSRESLPISYPRPCVEPAGRPVRGQECVVRARRPSLSLAVAQATVPNRVCEPGRRPGRGRCVSPMAPAAMTPTTHTTLTQIVVTAVAAVVVFVAVLVLALKLSRRRDRRREPGGQGLRPGSFGTDDQEDNAGAAGYGRPAGYGPPPLWSDPPYDQRSGWRLRRARLAHGPSETGPSLITVVPAHRPAGG